MTNLRKMVRNLPECETVSKVWDRVTESRKYVLAFISRNIRTVRPLSLVIDARGVAVFA